MKEYKADLHIHTCLSPCAGLDMSPKYIVNEAKRKGLEIIGICDHNSAENVPAVKKVAEKAGIKVIGGMEVTSNEEVHILTFFDIDKVLFSFQEIIYKHLPSTDNIKLYEEQVVVNENEEVLGFNRKLLIGATDLSVGNVIELAHNFNGLAIAAHIDRERFSIIGQLGFISDDMRFDGVEIMFPDKRAHIEGSQKFPVITSSDAHCVEDIGKRYTCFMMEDVNLSEIKKCLERKNGRNVGLTNGRFIITYS